MTAHDPHRTARSLPTGRGAVRTYACPLLRQDASEGWGPPPRACTAPLPESPPVPGYPSRRPAQAVTPAKSHDDASGLTTSPPEGQIEGSKGSKPDVS